MSTSRETRAADLQVGDRLRVVFSEYGYRLGGPGHWTMEVYRLGHDDGEVTIAFADGDHDGELTVPEAAPVWVAS